MLLFFFFTRRSSLTQQNVTERRTHAEKLPEHLVGRPEHKLEIVVVVARSLMMMMMRPLVLVVWLMMAVRMAGLVELGHQPVLAVLIVDASFALCTHREYRHY